jgi:hypothetical protein
MYCLSVCPSAYFISQTIERVSIKLVFEVYTKSCWSLILFWSVSVCCATIIYTMLYVKLKPNYQQRSYRNYFILHYVVHSAVLFPSVQRLIHKLPQSTYFSFSDSWISYPYQTTSTAVSVQYFKIKELKFVSALQFV